MERDTSADFIILLMEMLIFEMGEMKIHDNCILNASFSAQFKCLSSKYLMGQNMRMLSRSHESDSHLKDGRVSHQLNLQELRQVTDNITNFVVEHDGNSLLVR